MLPILKTALSLVLLLSLIGCGSGYDGSDTGAVIPTPTATPTLAPTTEPVSVIDTIIENAIFWAGKNDSGIEDVAVGSMSIVSVEHPNFSKAARISVSSPDGSFWNGQLSFPINRNIQAGDAVLARVFMRSIENSNESGRSFTTLFLEDIETFDKYITREITAGKEWEEYLLPAEIPQGYGSGELMLRIGFGAGNRPQVFEIGGVELLNYGNTEATLLPRTEESYVGREATAEWREAAAQRIEQYRKGDFNITVVDSEGKPVAGAAIDIQFQKHAYHFGSVTVGHILTSDSSDAAIYRQKVLELFNQSGPENDLKWGPWEGEWGSNFSREKTLSGLQWLRDNGFYTRGHVMVWPSKRNLPDLIQPLLPANDPASADPQAKQLVLEHIDDIASATINHLDEWDVLNEPYDNHYLMDAFGEQVMVDWFKRARGNLPNHKLYLNDYGIVSANGRDFSHQNHFKQTIRFLLENDAPLDGIGIQSHFSGGLTSIERVYAIIEGLHAEFPELDIRSTEFDIVSLDEQLQADYTRDFLTIFFSHPATVGVQLWGFWAGAHWNPDAALYDENWREKPNALAWKQQIYETWWSNFEGETNTQGDYARRGFFGEYQLTATLGDATKTITFQLEKGKENRFYLTLP